jgi:hypothetical protein
MRYALLLLLVLMVLVVAGVVGCVGGLLLLLVMAASLLLLLLLLLLSLLSLLLVAVASTQQCASVHENPGSSHSTYWSTSLSSRRLNAPGRWLCQYLSSWGSLSLGALSSFSHAVSRWPCTRFAVCSL